jgi:uncharacterized protein YjiS (DUF1127 family)
MSTETPLTLQILQLLSWPFRLAEHRRLLNELASFDDRELADIGLSRQDLRDVTALPLAIDPTEHLAQRARERATAALGAWRPATPPPAATARPKPYRIAAE